MFGSLDVSASALVAQRTRLDVISANLANIDSIVDENGNYAPYRRRFTVFGAGDPTSGSDAGVHVSKVGVDQSSPLRKVFEGVGAPFADAEGYVGYPNIDPTMELVSALEASRAYEANVTAAEATKSMIQSALRILA